MGSAPPRHGRADPEGPERRQDARPRSAEAHPQHVGIRARDRRIRGGRGRRRVEGRRMRVPTGPPPDGRGLHVGIVWSRFNEELVRELLTACDKQLVELGVAAADIDVVSVPGALEIPLALQAMALERRGFASRRYDALIALGAVGRGETYPFEIVANQNAPRILPIHLPPGV